MRVVFDTNILISALVFPGKHAEKAFIRAIDGPDRLLLSKPILDELLRALAQKFARDAGQIARTALLLSEVAEMIQPDQRLHVLRDEPDNRILECAVAGNADAIVTGDHEMLRLKDFAGITIISPRAYLDS